MINRFSGILILLAAFVFSGCIGGKYVESSYLRVGHSHELSPDCEKVRTGVPKLAVKRFTALPALDRETVVIAQGPVLKTDYRWSWEGTPAEIMDLEAGHALSCMESYEVVTPYRPGLERSVVLSGVITSFELQRSGSDEFHVAVRYSLWDGEGKNLLARKLIKAEEPVKSVDGHSIAIAAQQAVSEVMDDTINWLERLNKESILQIDIR